MEPVFLNCVLNIQEDGLNTILNNKWRNNTVNNYVALLVWPDMVVSGWKIKRSSPVHQSTKAIKTYHNKCQVAMIQYCKCMVSKRSCALFNVCLLENTQSSDHVGGILAKVSMTASLDWLHWSKYCLSYLSKFYNLGRSLSP